MNQAPFIIGSYGAAALVVAGLILWVFIDGRMQRTRLAALEARGVKRRSSS